MKQIEVFFHHDILPQLIATLSASLNTISEGMLYSWTSPAMPYLLSNETSIRIEKADEFRFEAMYLLSGLLGLLLTVCLVEKIGRKRTILLASVAALVAWTLVVLAHRVEYLYASRILCGTSADVAFVATPMYVSEIATKEHRGLLLGVLYFCEIVGIILMYSIGPFTPLYVPAFVGIALLLLQITTFLTMPESPYYLVGKGRIKEAGAALRRLRGGNSRCEEELNRIVQGKSDETSGRFLYGLRDLFVVPSNRRSFFIVMTLVTCQQFCGITVILMNLHVILIRADSNYLDANWSGITFAVLTAVAALVCIALVDRCGRKVLLVISGTLTCLCLGLFGAYFHLQELGVEFVKDISWVPTVNVMLYAIVFKLGLGFLPQTISSELYSNNVKAIGMTLTDGILVLAGTLSVVLYEKIAYTFGFYIPFYIYSGVALISVFFTIFYVPETKGKSLEEIQDMLKKS